MPAKGTGDKGRKERMKMKDGTGRKVKEEEGRERKGKGGREGGG